MQSDEAAPPQDVYLAHLGLGRSSRKLATAALSKSAEAKALRSSTLLPSAHLVTLLSRQCPLVGAVTLREAPNDGSRGKA